MQISPHSMGIPKFENTPARTNSESMGTDLLEVIQRKTLSGFRHSNLTSGMETMYDGIVQGGDSLCSSREMPNNIFQRLIQMGSKNLSKDGQMPKYSDTPKIKMTNQFDYELSCDVRSKETQSKQSKSRESGKGATRDKKEEENVGLNENLQVPRQRSWNKSQRSKDEESTGPILPVHKSSQRRIRHRKSMRLKKGGGPKINMFYDFSDNSSIQSKNQNALSVVTFGKNSKNEMLSSYSGENHSNDSRNKTQKKSSFMNSRVGNLHKKSRHKTSTSSESELSKKLKLVHYKLSVIADNFKIDDELKFVDKKIYQSTISQIGWVELGGKEALEQLLKVA